MSDNNLKEVTVSDIDALTLKYNSERMTGLEKDETILKLRKEVLDMQESLIESQKEIIKRDKMLLDNQILINKSKRSEVQDEVRNILAEITDSNPELKGKKWSYNPKTGKVIIDENVQAAS